MQTIYLDISNKGVVPTVYAKQNDVGRKFAVILTDSGLPYIPSGGSAFSVWYKGASGEGNYTDIGDRSAFSVNENRVTVEMIAQMLTNDGTGILCLVLNESDGNQIGSWNIPYLCEKVPGFESEGAKEYYTAFSKSVEKLKQVTENLTPEAIGAAPAVESAEYPGCYYRTVNGVVEWLNPPMVLGGEYRTTERWDGKPVYAQRVNLGTLPNATSGAVPLPIIGAETFIDYNLVETSTSNPQYQNLNTTDIELVFGFNDPGNTSGSTWADIHAKTNHSAYTGKLSVKYTKV